MKQIDYENIALLKSFQKKVEPIESAAETIAAGILTIIAIGLLAVIVHVI